MLFLLLFLQRLILRIFLTKENLEKLSQTIKITIKSILVHQPIMKSLLRTECNNNFSGSVNRYKLIRYLTKNSENGLTESILKSSVKIMIDLQICVLKCLLGSANTTLKVCRSRAYLVFDTYICNNEHRLN